VLNGFVHLTGTVDSNDTRSMAEEIVAKIKGVRGVVNRIEAPGSPHPARIIHLDVKTK
jgi:osmotically-inducible protein OsmY